MANLENNITVGILQSVFPEDTIWHFNVKEIVGYSISKNLHFVIEDGMCCSENGKWVLLIFSPHNSKHCYEWIPTSDRPRSIKYPNSDKVFEEYVNLIDEKETLKLYDIINQL